MNVQEIFNLPQIVEIETEILTTESSYRLRCDDEHTKVGIIKELLGIRKSILDQEFIMNEEYARLLSEFNECLRQKLVSLTKDMVKAYDAVKNTGIDCSRLSSHGECWLGFSYPKSHPVQTIRARKIWEILNGSRDRDYLELYDEGVDGWNSTYRGNDFDKEHLFEELEKDGFNFNHGIEGEFTDDMHIILPTHFLYHDKSFSMFDLLWQRNFYTEVYVEIDQDNPENGDDDLDLDWSKFDFYD